MKKGYKKEYDLDNAEDLKTLREQFEKEIILNRLKKFNYNITKTAQSLNIERTNLYKKLKKYGIDFDDF